MNKSVAILQPNYIPWKGYFDIIHSVDTFVLLDDVQYTKRDWRNRNLIKTPTGLLWLTVPVLTRGVQSQTIEQARIDSSVSWQKDHWQSIQQSYQKAPHFERYRELFEQRYFKTRWDSLVDLNYSFIEAICSVLGITTRIVKASDLNLTLDDADIEKKSKRLVEICNKVGAHHYLSGPAARDYINPQIFQANNITLQYKDYSYPEYPQLYPPFEHNVSIIDVIVHCGDCSARYIWGD